MKKFLIATPLVVAFALLGGVLGADSASAATSCTATKTVYVTDLTAAIDAANSDGAYTTPGVWFLSPNGSDGTANFASDGLYIDLPNAGPFTGMVSWPAGAAQDCEPVISYTATTGVTASMNAYGVTPGTFGIKKDPNTPASAAYWATSSGSAWQYDFTGVGKDAGCAVAANIKNCGDWDAYIADGAVISVVGFSIGSSGMANNASGILDYMIIGDTKYVFRAATIEAPTVTETVTNETEAGKNDGSVKVVITQPAATDPTNTYQGPVTYQVDLYDEGGTLVANKVVSTTAGQAGSANFGGLAPGNYCAVTTNLLPDIWEYYNTDCFTVAAGPVPEPKSGKLTAPYTGVATARTSETTLPWIAAISVFLVAIIGAVRYATITDRR